MGKMMEARAEAKMALGAKPLLPWKHKTFSRYDSLHTLLFSHQNTRRLYFCLRLFMTAQNKRAAQFQDIKARKCRLTNTEILCSHCVYEETDRLASWLSQNVTQLQ